MDIRRVRIKALKVAFLAVVMSLAARTTTYAGPLNIALDSDPVLGTTGAPLTMTFNALTGLFQASGTATFWTGKDASQTALAFKVLATFSGGQPTTASLIVGSEASPFLSATGLAGFAFSAAKGGTIEFLFDNVGGSSSLFSGADQLDVQITANANFAPQFTSSWALPVTGNTAVVRQTDTPGDPVPEPSALLALVAGAGGLLLRRRRRAANV